MRAQTTSIKRRLVRVILLTTVAVLLLTCLALLTYELYAYRRTTTQNLSTLAEIVADNSTTSLIYDDRKTANEILYSLRAEPEIVTAALYTTNGTLHATYPTNAPPDTIPAKPAPDGIDFTATELILFRPVIEESDRVGTLYIKADLSEMYRRFAVYGAVVAAVLGGSLVVAFFLSNVFQRRISQPILDLAGAARRISVERDFSVRAVKTSNDELGVLTEAFNTMLDQIQESHRALQENEARLRTLSEAIPAIVSVFDAEGKAEYLNSRWCEYTGMTLERSCGLGWVDAVHPEDVDRCFEKWKESVRTGKPLDMELRYGDANGNFRWFLARAVPLTGKNGKVLNWFGTSTDIESRKQMEEALQDAQERLSRHAQELEDRVAERTIRLTETIGELESFSYSISHDMRAPLRTMQGYSQLLIEDYADKLDEEGKDFLQRIGRASQRLDSLIRDILTYSRVARADIKLQPVNLQKVVEEIIQQFPEFQPPRARIEIKEPLLHVLGHEASLSQIISNLFGNAIKFVQPGEQPRIRVRTEQRGEQVRVWVEDNGIGIEGPDLKRIFGIFERIHGAEAYEGTGIGLSIVKKAVERMGGSVGVESEMGQGSRFWFQLKGS